MNPNQQGYPTVYQGQPTAYPPGQYPPTAYATSAYGSMGQPQPQAVVMQHQTIDVNTNHHHQHGYQHIGEPEPWRIHDVYFKWCIPTDFPYAPPWWVSWRHEKECGNGGDCFWRFIIFFFTFPFALVLSLLGIVLWPFVACFSCFCGDSKIVRRKFWRGIACNCLGAYSWFCGGVKDNSEACCKCCDGCCCIADSCCTCCRGCCSGLCFLLCALRRLITTPSLNKYSYDLIAALPTSKLCVVPENLKALLRFSDLYRHSSLMALYPSPAQQESRRQVETAVESYLHRNHRENEDDDHTEEVETESKEEMTEDNRPEVSAQLSSTAIKYIQLSMLALVQEPKSTKRTQGSDDVQ
ncbi:hypothetical protein PROFUN_06963 [Planoprotostelium fungivorum]|uniref:Uncharacterized protein n=1 Tax=Planoprotostelium fungivorum TaxID=1890364 RepID=A0A2P6NN99_9EUKA|nr:hypothetical protein PROFUN_06963 [Planoprotostelium fungivorum]